MASRRHRAKRNANEARRYKRIMRQKWKLLLPKSMLSNATYVSWRESTCVECGALLEGNVWQACGADNAWTFCFHDACMPSDFRVVLALQDEA